MNTPSSRNRSGVFISYSRKDGEAFANRLRAQLEERRIPLWQDLTRLEGGRDWWEQIKDALNHVEYMVLVMTPGAAQSPIVRKEWRYARQEGVCVYPVFASRDFKLEELPRWMRQAHWYDLQSQGDKFFNDLNTRCRAPRVPFMAEDLPPDYVPRNEEFSELKRLLLDEKLEEPVAITAALRGAGGYGKTVLANALCHDEDIQNAFDEGILLVRLGEKPTQAEIISKLADLIETLSGERPGFVSLEAAITRFRELLDQRDILLVIDDAWRADDVRPFLHGGPHCARLITTRRNETLPRNARTVRVDQMRTSEAHRLLVHGLNANSLEARLQALAARLGEWPLLLKLANGMLHNRVADRQPLATALDSLERALHKKGLTAFDVRDAQHRDEAVARTIEVSLDWLDEDDRQRLLDLAVFPEDIDVPLAVLAQYWSETPLEDFEVDEICGRLHSASLLLERNLGDRHIRLHDTIRQYLILKKSRDETVALHRTLLRRLIKNGNALTPHSPAWYLQEHSAYHFFHADRIDRLRGLLTSFGWILGKLYASLNFAVHPPTADINALLSDYEYVPNDPDVALVQRALRMSAHVIASHPEQLGPQLFGRLGTSESPTIRQLCQQAADDPETLIAQRPALRPPGIELMTLEGDFDWIDGAMILDGGTRALAWWRQHIQVWDLRSGQIIHSLPVEKGEVQGLMCYAQDRRLLSWGDGALQVWDLQKGALLYHLAGHERKHLIGGVHVFGNDTSALSWSSDGTLRSWDLQRGEARHVLRGHQESIIGVRLLESGKRALSWSDDRTLIVWDLATGRKLNTLVGHTNLINGVQLSANHRRALSSSSDKTLRLWDLESGKSIHVFAGKWPIKGALLLDSGNRAVSWSTDDALALWDLERGAHIHAISLSSVAIDLVVPLSDGRRLLVGPRHSTAEHSLTLVDVETRAVPSRFPHENVYFPEARLFADERRLLTWDRGGSLKVWDTDRGALLHTLDHGRSLSGVALLEDQRRALVWGQNLFGLWDLEQGIQRWTVTVHEDDIGGAITFDRDRKALSWSEARSLGVLKVLDLETREILPGTAAHNGAVNGVAYFDERRRVLSWGSDRALKVWNAASGELLHTLTGHEDRVIAACLVTDRTALSWSADNTLRLWDLDRYEPVHVFRGHEGRIGGALLLDDGRALSWSEDATLRAWSLTTGELLYTASHSFEQVVAVLPLVDDRVLTLSRDGKLITWDVIRGRQLRIVNAHKRTPAMGAMLLGHDRLLTWEYERQIKVWDLKSCALLKTVPTKHFTVGGQALPDGHRALIFSGNSQLLLFDFAGTGPPRSLAGHYDHVVGAILLDNGQSVLSWSRGGSLMLSSLSNRHPPISLDGHEHDIYGALLLDGERCALTWSADETLRLWDLQSGTLQATYYADASITGLVFDETNRTFFCGDALGQLHFVRIADCLRENPALP